VRFRVLLDGEVLLEHADARNDARPDWHVLPLAACGRRSARFEFAVDGDPANAVFACPTVGPAEIGARNARPWGAAARARLLTGRRSRAASRGVAPAVCNLDERRQRRSPPAPTRRARRRTRSVETARDDRHAEIAPRPPASCRARRRPTTRLAPSSTRASDAGTACSAGLRTSHRARLGATVRADARSGPLTPRARVRWVARPLPRTAFEGAGMGLRRPGRPTSALRPSEDGQIPPAGPSRGASPSDPPATGTANLLLRRARPRASCAWTA
jgi:hypothetical protein